MSGAEHIRFRGVVQGVGFRPTVARVARAAGLRGWVRNDGEGVLVALAGSPDERDRFVSDLMEALPPLARVHALERSEADDPGEGFVIVASEATAAQTAVAADAAPCGACTEEVRDPFSRRYRYPFTNCTHCGPRFTLVQAIPYDRPNTTMAGFTLCEDCQREYDDETDRRYHAQPIACGRCGPQAALVRTDGHPVSYATFSMLDDVDAARTLLQRGEIVMIKGLGGYQLCCDATNPEAVRRLRERKKRPDKPLALLVESLEALQRFATTPTPLEVAALEGPANPIVLLAADGPEQVAPQVAPGQDLLGFMLPPTPLHQLVMRRIGRPIVCTSGNLSDEPQATDDVEALERLGHIADWALLHDRPIAHRIDDSVVRQIAGQVRVIRRARGYAPTPLVLHPSFAAAPSLTALGGHLKATFCLLQQGRAVLSPHIGDLDEPRTVGDYHHIHGVLTELFEHTPTRIVLDRHPGYETRTMARGSELPLVEVAHHHAHAAACMAENGLPVDTPPVLALVLDGLGLGPDGDLWGGELLLADFVQARRVGGLPSIPLIGGDAAAREPWRSAVAHLVHALGIEALARVPALAERWTPLLEGAYSRAPRASSAGRLFDALAALLGVAPERVTFEAQAPMALEALARRAPVAVPYPIDVDEHGHFELAPLWEAVLDDLDAGTPVERIAAGFHAGLAEALVRAVRRHPGVPVALSGGVWQNAWLTERVVHGLQADGRTVLLHTQTPPNDGCLALGQAAIAAARALQEL